MAVLSSSFLTLCQTHKLLHNEEGYDSTQHPQSHHHVLHVVVGVATVVVMVMVIRVRVVSQVIFVVVVVVVVVVMVVRGNGMRNEVQKSVSE